MVVGVSMVRDELDILPYVLQRMQPQLDHIIIADNLSKDGTREFLADYAADHDITVLHDDVLAYTQSEKMTALGRVAKEMGAEWIVPFDADEVWVSDLGGLKNVLNEYDATVIQVHLYNHVATRMDRDDIQDPIWRMQWMRAKYGALPKVAFRPLTGFVIEQGNHGVHFPGPVEPQFTTSIHIRHYPYRSADQMVRKARNGAEAYAAAGDAIPQSIGQHWRDYGNLLRSGGPESIHEVFYTWFYSDRPTEDEELVISPCPL